ncbi:VVA0879 family protein [Pseudomonas sp. USHLN015]|uniref:VVA0879 family protein n=1 Tax=Pseudomonas sp. USHLN015 TaxID=3081296 RepID=UPI00301CFB7F
MKTVTLDEYRSALKAQGVPREHMAWRCPMCSTVQSAADLIAAGVGDKFEAVELYLAFNCVGRYTGAGSPSEMKGQGKGCNWTLGGLFRMHELEVVTEDGKRYPQFEPASPEEALAHMQAKGLTASACAEGVDSEGGSCD